jgi:hypothetical protein
MSSGARRKSAVGSKPTSILQFLQPGRKTMKKVALFVFNGDPMCFIHVLLNALDLNEKGNEVQIIVEGAATKLVPEMVKEDHPLFKLYGKALEKGLIAGACKACSAKLGVKQAIEQTGLPLLDDMAGHPGMAEYLDAGFEIISF